MPYPLLLEPILLPKVWGGSRLARFGKAVSPADRIGESWELADLPSTSAGGAGGGAARSRIRNGALAGMALHDAMATWGVAAVLGDIKPTLAGGFPLLIKFLDARESLSVQVHPSPAYARAHADAHLKTECWYILDAQPSSLIYKGVKPGVTRERFADALRAGDGRRVVAMLEAVPARAGDMHNLPSGTVHALGAGVLVAEVQTPSDTTFRVYDWDRTEHGTPRALHIEQSLACIQWEQAREATRLPSGLADDRPFARLVTTGYFDVDAARPQAGLDTALADTSSTAARPVVLIVLPGGEGQVRSTRNAFEPVNARAGDTLLIPAALARDACYRVTAQAPPSGDLATLLRAIPR